MRYFLIAGEASGDLHAAGLIRAIRQLDPKADITFMGGDLMAAEAGRAPEVHYRSMAYMGFAQVIRHLPDVRRNIAEARRIVSTQRPDAVILIDYPGFNLRIAAYTHRLGIRTYYYIPPKVWAWKEHRIKDMRRDIDRIFAILPFEPEYYRSKGMEVEYVGNPSVVEVDRRLAQPPKPIEGVEPEHPVIALVPGSRVSEIRSNLPVMAEVARRIGGAYSYVVAGAPAVDPEIYNRIAPGLTVATDSTFELMRAARAALVTSGTATLECALCGTPQVACYRGNGSRLTYAIMSRWLKIPYVTLPNLIAGRQVIPEMLMHQCNADAVESQLRPLLAEGSAARTAQLDGYAEIRRRLGSADPAVTAASIIVESGR